MTARQAPPGNPPPYRHRPSTGGGRSGHTTAPATGAALPFSAGGGLQVVSAVVGTVGVAFRAAEVAAAAATDERLAAMALGGTGAGRADDGSGGRGGGDGRDGLPGCSVHGSTRIDRWWVEGLEPPTDPHRTTEAVRSVARARRPPMRATLADEERWGSPSGIPRTATVEAPTPPHHGQMQEPREAGFLQMLKAGSRPECITAAHSSVGHRGATCRYSGRRWDIGDSRASRRRSRCFQFRKHGLRSWPCSGNSAHWTLAGRLHCAQHEIRHTNRPTGPPGVPRPHPPRAAFPVAGSWTYPGPIQQPKPATSRVASTP